MTNDYLSLNFASPRFIVSAFFLLVAGIILLAFLSDCFYIIQPGDRGVLVTLGKADAQFKAEGFGFKMPWISSVIPVTVKVQGINFKAECFSSDLQDVSTDVTVNYHVNETDVVKIYTGYSGDLVSTVIEPRSQEALKEHTASRTAEEIVKEREQVKNEAITSLKEKTANIVVIDDLVIQNVSLSPQLEEAIEAKMTQQQKADQAKFAQDQAKIDADTAVITAQGQAKANQIIGDAITKNPAIVQLKIVEKWDGHAPTYVSSGAGGAALLMPAAAATEQR